MADTTSSIKSWPQLILFGDSQFQTSFSPDASLGSRLADRLQRRCDVINRGFTGYNTALAKLVLPQVFSKDSLTDAAGVIILFGSNDAAVEERGPANQHLPLATFAANMTDIVQHFLDCGVPKERIILIAPPPVEPAAWDAACLTAGRPESPRSNTAVEAYANAVYEVAKEQGTLYLNLYDGMMAKSNWQSFLADGLHFSSSGSIFFFDKLWPLVDRMLKSYPVLFPDWKDVDLTNPDASF